MSQRLSYSSRRRIARAVLLPIAIAVLLLLAGAKLIVYFAAIRSRFPVPEEAPERQIPAIQRAACTLGCADALCG